MKIECKKNDNGIGHGVFATSNIAKGELIDSCPVIFLEKEESEIINELGPKKSKLYNYVFDWEEDSHVLLTGFGPLFNHASHSNSFFIKNKKENTVDFYSSCPIKRGQEITISYGV